MYLRIIVLRMFVLVNLNHALQIAIATIRIAIVNLKLVLQTVSVTKRIVHVKHRLALRIATVMERIVIVNHNLVVPIMYTHVSVRKNHVLEIMHIAATIQRVQQIVSVIKQIAFVRIRRNVIVKPTYGVVPMRIVDVIIRTIVLV